MTDGQSKIAGETDGSVEPARSEDGQMFDIWVISLPGEEERKEFQRQQMKRLGLEAEFVDAVTPSSLPEDELKRLAESWARPLRSTEVALTQSHLRVWEAVVRTGRPTLIMEDDAVLCASVAAVLAYLSSQPKLGFVQLETFNTPKLVKRRKTGVAPKGHYIHRLYRDRGGAAAYFVRPATAKKLIASVAKTCPPADAAINLALGIRRYQMIPACAVQVMHLDPETPIYRDLAYLSPSRVNGAPKPTSGSARLWFTQKARRAMISAILLGKTIAPLWKGKNKLVEYTGR